MFVRALCMFGDGDKRAFFGMRGILQISAESFLPHTSGEMT